VGRSVSLCKLQPLLVDIHSDDLLGAQSLGDGHDEETDRSSTEYDDVLSRLELAERGNGVHSHGKGFHHSTVFEGH
jgi:hypothetical protein